MSERRSISADTALRLGRYFGNRPQFWLDLQSQYDLALIERDRGAEIEKRVRHADADMNPPEASSERVARRHTFSHSD